jgi:hypothetical protein
MTARVSVIYTLFAASILASTLSSFGQLTNGTLTAIPDGKGLVSLQWNGFSDLPLNVQRSTSLPRGEWTTLSFSNSTGAHVDSNPPADKAFYRLVLPSTIHVSPGLIRDNWWIFGETSMNAHYYAITISNSGPAVLTVTGVERELEGVNVFDYAFHSQPLPFKVPPGQQKVVTVKIQTYFTFMNWIEEYFVIRSSATAGSDRVRVEGYVMLDPSAWP